MKYDLQDTQHSPRMTGPIADATPAYRGYRRQALYTLARVLEPGAEGLTFQPEGIEDLAVYDNGQLVEAIQVKSFGANVTLSDLVSTRRPESSFFHRAVSLVRDSSCPRVTLASFGPMGPELDRALAGDDLAQAEVSRKLVETYGFTPEGVSAVLEVLVAENVDEGTLTKRIFRFLRCAVTGADPEAAFDLLNHWLYGCAERKCHLSRQDVVDRINRVGRFVTEREAHHTVWFTSVVPLEDHALDLAEREILREDFYRGVSARYDHILADVDIPRPEKVDHITAAFAERNTVILHAASGQGKSTLAYRYMQQELEEAWRYHVRLVDGRTHAQVIATALEGYAYALGVPIAVFVDVSSRDIGWTELVERLAMNRSIRVMVAVREEDWRQARFVDTDIFRDVELDFDCKEAKKIYSSFVESQLSPPFLDFEEAWTRFGERGPLLEFVYLVTQGGLLRERLTDQIVALKRAANRGQRSGAELDLLRLVSLAAAFGGRLSVKSLASHLRLPALDEAVSLLEKEYLLRRAEGGSLVEGLHQIRSEMLAELLTDRETAPWPETAATVLGLLDERDLESFLLHTFSRRRSDINEVVDALMEFRPVGWVGIAGAMHALIWLGLRQYADANAELISDARRDAGPGWSVVLDADIADAMPDSAQSFLASLENLATRERLAEIEAFRARQTPKETAFLLVASWLKARTDPPVRPSSVDEWLAAAAAAFWIGRLDGGWPLTDWLPMEATSDAANTLPLDAAADLVVGLAEGYGAKFAAWLEDIRPVLRERFQTELMSPVLEDDGARITAHFLVNPDVPSEVAKSEAVMTIDAENPLHNEALIRVNVLRRLFPDREAYGCQGYGHGETLLQMPIDDTRKVGIPQFRLPLRWQTSVNATFGGIVAYDTRPLDWVGYAREVMVLREEVVRCLADLRKVLPDYLRSFRPLAVKIPSGDWYKTWTLLRDPPRLPQCAVDEWGFVYESLNKSEDERADVEGQTGLGRIPTVRRYRPIIEGVQGYVRSLGNFLIQAQAVISANQRVGKRSIHTGRAKSPITRDLSWEQDKERRLSTQNLADAWMELSEMQRRYRQYFSDFTDRRQIERLEQREIELFEHVWPLWFAFALQPDRTLDSPIREASQLLDRTIQRLQRALRQELSGGDVAGVAIAMATGGVSWEGEPVLRLTIDAADGVAVYNAANIALDMVFRAISSIPNDELRRHALDFCWKEIVIVPLVRGQSLAGMAWRVRTASLIRAGGVKDLGWMQLSMQPIPTEELAQLEIRIWKDERLALGTRLAEATDQLWLLVMHMAEMSELPEVSGFGEILALHHIDETFSRVSAAAQAVQDTIDVLASAISDAIDSQQVPSSGSLHLAFEALKELQQVVLPAGHFDGNAKLEVRQFRPWAQRLREGLRYALIAQLSWATVVLGTTSRGPDHQAVTDSVPC